MSIMKMLPQIYSKGWFQRLFFCIQASSIFHNMHEISYIPLIAPRYPKPNISWIEYSGYNNKNCAVFLYFFFPFIRWHACWIDVTHRNRNVWREKTLVLHFFFSMIAFILCVRIHIKSAPHKYPTGNEKSPLFYTSILTGIELQSCSLRLFFLNIPALCLTAIKIVREG